LQKVKNTVISNIKVFIITSAAIIKKNILQGLAKYCLNANGQNSVMKQYTWWDDSLRERGRSSYKQNYSCYTALMSLIG